MTETNKKVLDLRRSKRSAGSKTADSGASSQQKKANIRKNTPNSQRAKPQGAQPKQGAQQKQGGHSAGRAQQPQKSKQNAEHVKPTEHAKPRAKSKNELRIIPLGGLNEIGKNITAFEYGNDIIIVDCGMSFPEDEMFGIDVVIPDFDYLVENSTRIRGLFITHGHEDHIGAVPYLLKKLPQVPIYATRLTIGLIESKLSEHGLRANVRTIAAGQTLRVGVFNVEAIRMTHSIADSLAFAITTPTGTVFHTGDFKIDYTPVDGDPMDFQKLAQIGSKGVLLMLSDSTNAVRQGYTKSERHLDAIMDGIFSDTKGRIIVATFASNVHRIQTIINTAVRYGRKVTLSGRSMLNVLDAASKIGELKYDRELVVEIEKIKNIEDKSLVIITTGSQGEPMSALTRMAYRAMRRPSQIS